MIIFPSQNARKIIPVSLNNTFFLLGHSRSLKNSKTIIFACPWFHNWLCEASPSLKCDSSANRNQYPSASAMWSPNVALKAKKEVMFSISIIALDALGQFRWTLICLNYYQCSFFFLETAEINIASFLLKIQLLQKLALTWYLPGV